MHTGFTAPNARQAVADLARAVRADPGAIARLRQAGLASVAAMLLGSGVSDLGSGDPTSPPTEEGL